jgi:hypothetical protein
MDLDLAIGRPYLNKRLGILVVFSVGCLLRLVPEVVAYPYPIGYDVINYYIPVISNFEENWPSISKQFPFYAYILYLVNTNLGLDPQTTVTTISIITFGFFAVSIFGIGVRLLKLPTNYGILFVAFIIFQIAVLRTAWDLHKDIFALTTMFFAFSLLPVVKRSVNLNVILLVISLCVITAIADRMVGILFIFSLIIYSILNRSRMILLYVFAAIGLAISMIPVTQYFSNLNMITLSTETIASTSTPESYTPLNLFVIFVVINGLLIPLAIMGFIRIKENLLKISLLVTIAGTFTWIVFPYSEGLAADRWTILCGIFLSIFAAYAIVNFIQSKVRLTKTIAYSIFAFFIIIGLMYAVLPYDKPLLLHWIARENLQYYIPLTMQFNSIDVKNNDDLLSAILWINDNTDTNAIIVGEKHLTGWMEIGLKDNRTYQSASDIEQLIEHVSPKYDSGYLITYDNNYLIDTAPAPVFSNTIFSIYRIR